MTDAELYYVRAVLLFYMKSGIRASFYPFFSERWLLQLVVVSSRYSTCLPSRVCGRVPRCKTKSIIIIISGPGTGTVEPLIDLSHE